MEQQSKKINILSHCLEVFIYIYIYIIYICIFICIAYFWVGCECQQFWPADTKSFFLLTETFDTEY